MLAVFANSFHFTSSWAARPGREWESGSHHSSLAPQCPPVRNWLWSSPVPQRSYSSPAEHTHMHRWGWNSTLSKQKIVTHFAGLDWLTCPQRVEFWRKGNECRIHTFFMLAPSLGYGGLLTLLFQSTGTLIFS